MIGRDADTNRKAAVLRIIASAARRSPQDLCAPDLLEDDLGLTSLDIVTITMELEKVFGLAIDDSAAAQVTTVGEFIDLVERTTRSPGDPP
jgi:acyl carrier protein